MQQKRLKQIQKVWNQSDPRFNSSNLGPYYRFKKYKQLIKTISAVTLTLSVNFEQHFMYISTLKLMWDTLQYVDIKF